MDPNIIKSTAAGAQPPLDTLLGDLRTLTSHVVATSQTIGESFRRETAYPLLFSACALGGIIVCGVIFDMFTPAELKPFHVGVILTMFTVTLLFGLVARAFEIWLAVGTSTAALKAQQEAIAAFAEAREGLKF